MRKFRPVNCDRADEPGRRVLEYIGEEKGRRDVGEEEEA